MEDESEWKPACCSSMLTPIPLTTHEQSEHCVPPSHFNRRAQTSADSEAHLPLIPDLSGHVQHNPVIRLHCTWVRDSSGGRVTSSACVRLRACKVGVTHRSELTCRSDMVKQCGARGGNLAWDCANICRAVFSLTNHLGADHAGTHARAHTHTRGVQRQVYTINLPNKQMSSFEGKIKRGVDFGGGHLMLLFHAYMEWDKYRPPKDPPAVRPVNHSLGVQHRTICLSPARVSLTHLAPAAVTPAHLFPYSHMALSLSLYVCVSVVCVPVRVCVAVVVTAGSARPLPLCLLRGDSCYPAFPRTRPAVVLGLRRQGTHRWQAVWGRPIGGMLATTSWFESRIALARMHWRRQMQRLAGGEALPEPCLHRDYLYSRSSGVSFIKLMEGAENVRTPLSTQRLYRKLIWRENVRSSTQTLTLP